MQEHWYAPIMFPVCTWMYLWLVVIKCCEKIFQKQHIPLFSQLVLQEHEPQPGRETVEDWGKTQWLTYRMLQQHCTHTSVTHSWTTYYLKLVAFLLMYCFPEQRWRLLGAGLEQGWEIHCVFVQQGGRVSSLTLLLRTPFVYCVHCHVWKEELFVMKAETEGHRGREM